MTASRTGFFIADPRIVGAVATMQSANGKRVNVAELADAVNLSLSRFRAVFKVSMGVSPARYLKSLRLERADSLVRETFMTVKQIMVATGFDDESHFLRDYKQSYGCSPRERRRRQFRQ